MQVSSLRKNGHICCSYVRSAMINIVEFVADAPSVSAMKAKTNLPISVKTRLCTPPSDTVRLALLLQEAGAAHITLHARFPSAKHRRHGAAQLDFVRDLKAALSIPVISNGNTSNHADFMHNLDYTGADGIMAGEGILKNP